MASGFDVAMQKVKAIHKVNKEISARINRAASGKKQQVARQLLIDPTSRTNVIMKDTPLSYESLIKNWKPRSVPQFRDVPEMKLFNDVINYSITSHEDVLLLNDKLLEVAMKFEWLDPRKAVAVVDLFKANLEIVQTLLGDIETLILPPRDVGINALEAEGAILEVQLKALAERVSEWNSKYSTAHLIPQHVHQWHQPSGRFAPYRRFVPDQCCAVCDRLGMGCTDPTCRMMSCSEGHTWNHPNQTPLVNSGF